MLPGHSPARPSGWRDCCRFLWRFSFATHWSYSWLHTRSCSAVGVVKLRVNCVKKMLTRPEREEAFSTADLWTMPRVRTRFPIQPRMHMDAHGFRSPVRDDRE